MHGLLLLVSASPDALGEKGVSPIVVEDGSPGFGKGRKLEKIGLHAHDTSGLFADNDEIMKEITSRGP